MVSSLSTEQDECFRREAALELLLKIFMDLCFVPEGRGPTGLCGVGGVVSGGVGPQHVAGSGGVQAIDGRQFGSGQQSGCSLPDVRMESG